MSAREAYEAARERWEAAQALLDEYEATRPARPATAPPATPRRRNPVSVKHKRIEELWRAWDGEQACWRAALANWELKRARLLQVYEEAVRRYERAAISMNHAPR